MEISKESSGNSPEALVIRALQDDEYAEVCKITELAHGVPFSETGFHWKH